MGSIILKSNRASIMRNPYKNVHVKQWFWVKYRKTLIFAAFVSVFSHLGGSGSGGGGLQIFQSGFFSFLKYL